MKILNLYACLGGNRYKWNEINNDIKVTAVELDPKLCELYQLRFPNDQVICTDAHQFLLDNYKNFDFIWSSPPCPTHSKVRFTQKNQNFYKAKYPNMMLYQEIIFLQHHFKGKFVVENVTPYYDPLIPGQKRGRHIYWANFKIPNDIERKEGTGIIGGQTTDEFKKLCNFHNYDFNLYTGEQSKIKIARNLVDYEVGKTIFAAAYNILETKKTKQINLNFDYEVY
jgi:DNA (cytosine-5)-methyltransferase 1